jgi:hypothetical protein
MADGPTGAGGAGGGGAGGGLSANFSAILAELKASGEELMRQYAEVTKVNNELKGEQDAARTGRS